MPEVFDESRLRDGSIFDVDNPRFSGVAPPPPPPSDWVDPNQKREYRSAIAVPKLLALRWIVKHINRAREALLSTLDAFYYDLGNRVARSPKTTILVTILMTLLAATGVMHLVIENQGLYLWIPQGNQDWRNFEFNRDTFGGQARDTLALITAKEGGSLLNQVSVICAPRLSFMFVAHPCARLTHVRVYLQETMVAIMNFHNELTTTISTADGETFQDLCFKSEQGCAVNNFLAIWGYDAANVPEDETVIVASINQFGTLAPIEISFGGLTYDSADPTIVTAAESVRLQYTITNNDQSAAMAWEQAVLDATAPYSSTVISIDRITKRSIDDEVVRLVSGDSPLFAGAILAIVGWLACTFGKLNKVESRFLITWAVLVEILLCLIFAFGVSSGWEVWRRAFCSHHLPPLFTPCVRLLRCSGTAGTS